MDQDVKKNFKGLPENSKMGQDQSFTDDSEDEESEEPEVNNETINLTTLNPELEDFQEIKNNDKWEKSDIEGFFDADNQDDLLQVSSSGYYRATDNSLDNAYYTEA